MLNDKYTIGIRGRNRIIGSINTTRRPGTMMMMVMVMMMTMSMMSRAMRSAMARSSRVTRVGLTMHRSRRCVAHCGRPNRISAVARREREVD